MVVIAAFYDVLRWIITILSLVFVIRKFYRWARRKFRCKRKTTAK